MLTLNYFESANKTRIKESGPFMRFNHSYKHDIVIFEQGGSWWYYYVWPIVSTTIVRLSIGGLSRVRHHGALRLKSKLKGLYSLLKPKVSPSILSALNLLPVFRRIKFEVYVGLLYYFNPLINIRYNKVVNLKPNHFFEKFIKRSGKRRAFINELSSAWRGINKKMNTKGSYEANLGNIARSRPHILWKFLVENVFNSIRRITHHNRRWYQPVRVRRQFKWLQNPFSVILRIGDYVLKYTNEAYWGMINARKEGRYRIFDEIMDEFNWRLEERKRYFQHRRWKKAVILKMLLSQMLGEYRKIKKSKFFNKLLRMYFYNISSLTWEGSLYGLWQCFRSYNRRYSLVWSGMDGVKALFDLRVVSIILMLGFFIYTTWATDFASEGFIQINGLTTINPNKVFSMGDIMQLNFFEMREYMQNFSLIFWSAAFIQGNSLSFMDACHSIMAYSMIRLPYRYELNIPHDLFLNSRTFMYLIRQSHTKESKNPTWERLLGDRRVYSRQKIKLNKSNGRAE